MSEYSGIFATTTKSGKKYYRSSFTYQTKHISLGSFDHEELAKKAYMEAKSILDTPFLTPLDYHFEALPFDKFISILNFRDNKVYFKTPIYIRKNYFSYYINAHMELQFDREDLFYYASHKILQRGGYLFVNDYGMQLNIMSRFGVKNHAIEGIHYFFRDGNPLNLRYSNIAILIPYYGVYPLPQGEIGFITKININGAVIVGKYKSQVDAAIAYNKAIDCLTEIPYLNKMFTANYIDTLDPIAYSSTYSKLRFAKTFRLYLDQLKQKNAPNSND